MSHDLLDLPPVVLRSKVVDQTVPRDDTIADHVVVLRSEAVRQMAEEEIVVVGRIVVLELVTVSEVSQEYNSNPTRLSI